MTGYAPSTIFGVPSLGTEDRVDMVYRLRRAIREAYEPSGTIGAVEAIPSTRIMMRVPIRSAVAPEEEPASKLEAARQAWRAGLSARVQAVEVLMSGLEQTDLPTPEIDGDD